MYNNRINSKPYMSDIISGNNSCGNTTQQQPQINASNIQPVQPCTYSNTNNIINLLNGGGKLCIGKTEVFNPFTGNSTTVTVFTKTEYVCGNIADLLSDLKALLN